MSFALWSQRIGITSGQSVRRIANPCVDPERAASLLSLFIRFLDLPSVDGETFP